jgi:transposase
VLVANPRMMDGSKRRKRKNDRIDANKLARLGRVDPQSLHPIQHRSREVRQDLVILRAREALVAARTELINATRGLVKSMGTRLPKCSSLSFAEKLRFSFLIGRGSRCFQAVVAFPAVMGSLWNLH